MEQFFHGHGQYQVWRNMRAKYLLLSEPMDQGGSQLRDQLRFLDACHQVRNHQQQRRRMKQWKRHQPMAEEELDFEGDRCRLMKVACWEHIVWSTFSFKEYKYWSRDRELQIRCKQPSWKSFANIEPGADTTADQPTRVWTEEAEIQVYQEELEQMKLAAIFANECCRDFLSFSKPGIDSCI